ncbi:hypothetical protein VCR31J2_1280124 [Vibrio coralliirubri]|uniref:Uncharacterized protein n=1 Tax=Vibrio coralliirubri TaxID=1516159 RepID=A0AA86X092_9VIBR|nr:hypothetical protein VCR31J2_1280124 [Vibrio coralliirubri]
MRHGIHGFVLYLFDECNDSGVTFIVIIAYGGSDPSKIRVYSVIMPTASLISVLSY